jgi:hypothetical protein
MVYMALFLGIALLAISRIVDSYKYKSFSATSILLAFHEEKDFVNKMGNDTLRIGEALEALAGGSKVRANHTANIVRVDPELNELHESTIILRSCHLTGTEQCLALTDCCCCCCRSIHVLLPRKRVIQKRRDQHLSSPFSW